MANYPNTEKLFDNKIVVGSSAGANMLSTNYWSSTNAKHGKGLGIVDLNIMVHYGATLLDEGRITRSAEEWSVHKAAYQQIIGQNNQITFLPEGSIVVVDK